MPKNTNNAIKLEVRLLPFDSFLFLLYQVIIQQSI